MKRRRRKKTYGPLLQANPRSGRKLRKNAKVTMPLKALRRLVSSARRGEKAVVKAVVH